MTPLSARSIEVLIDLVEIKLSYLDVQDRDDKIEQKILTRSLVELRTLTPSHPNAVTKFVAAT